MTSLISKDALVDNPLDRIRQWQDSHVNLVQSDDPGIVGRLFAACLNVFRTILERSNKSDGLSKQQAKRLRRSYGLLQQWGDYYKAMGGDLDRRLQKSRELQRTTIGLLQGIGESLSLSKLWKLMF
jgi:hypothetical protein